MHALGVARRVLKGLGHSFHLLLWLLLGVLHASSVQATGWLATFGNHIINSADESVWIGRGANLHDTRSCGGGTLEDGTPINDNATGVAEVKRRIDVLTDQWHASFIRLALESRRQGDSYLDDVNYRSKIIEIVNYIGTKPGVYVLVSIWIDPSLTPDGVTGGRPTAATNAILAQLATDFYASPHVLYGVSNEPQENFDGAYDAEVWTTMNDAVAAIRNAENALGGAHHHIVTVQGTRDWARDISYYVAHPITAGGGANVAYETHIYNSPADFASLLLVGPPARTIPVIVGEFGPIQDEWHAATVNDMQTLIDLANANNIPHLAWTFHQYCPPNLIADTAGMTWEHDSTPLDWHGMPIYPTDFGQLLKDNLLAAGAALLNTDFPYDVTSTVDNVTRATTAQVTRLDNFGAEKRPVVVLMPGWGGVGDVAAAQDAQAIMFANQGYVALNIGFHQTSDVPFGVLAEWNSDLAESAKAALDVLCAQAYADCGAVVITGQSYGGTQTHPVVRYLRFGGAYDGTNAGRKVVAILAQDSGYTQYWDPPIDAEATQYSIAMIENLGDTTFPVDACDFGNCGARNRADFHQTAPGSQFVLSYCPAGGEHGTRGYADWDVWVLSAVKTMLHNQRGVPKFTGYVEPSLAVSNACVTTPLPGAPTIGTATAGAGQLSVNFTPGSLNGGTLTNHQVTCAAASGPAYNGYGSSSPIIVTGLTGGVAYRCWARTLTNVGTSPWSGASNWATPTAATGPPAAPVMGTATAGAGQVSVSFTPGSLNGGTLTNHHVTCTATSGAAYNGYGAGSPIVVTGLTGGVAYRCWARTLTNLGTSPWSGASNWATPTTTTGPPTAPVMGTATPGAGQVSVSFTPGNLNGGTLTNHHVTCTAASGPAYNGYGASSPVIMTGLTSGVAYRCWARTVTNLGTSLWSGASNWATPTSGGLPGAPVMGTATAGAGQVSVSFTPGSLNGGMLITHQVTCAAASGPAYNGYRPSSPVIVSGLTGGIAYHCWARTLTNLGTSPWSGASNWATPTTTTGPPNAPVMGTATAGAGQVSVSFTPGNLNGGTLTNHHVTCTAASGPAYNGYGASSPVIVSGLTSGVAYRCWARTLTNLGTSPWSGASNWATPTP